MALVKGQDVTKATVLQEYITRVYNESAGAITAHPDPEFVFTEVGYPDPLGPELPAPVEDDLKTEVDAKDLVDLLRVHAYNLSRYRKATWIIDGNAFQAGTYAVDVQSRLNDDYRDGEADFNDAVNVLGVPEVTSGLKLIATKMQSFIERLRDVYIEVRDSGVEVHDCHGSCHNNCHNQCHGSRGRR